MWICGCLWWDNDVNDNDNDNNNDDDDDYGYYDDDVECLGTDAKPLHSSMIRHIRKSPSQRAMPAPQPLPPIITRLRRFHWMVPANWCTPIRQASGRQTSLAHSALANTYISQMYICTYVTFFHFLFSLLTIAGIKVYMAAVILAAAKMIRPILVGTQIFYVLTKLTPEQNAFIA